MNNLLHVQLADEAICIGPASGSDSYLRTDRILSAAEVGDIDAIHPGYGFLSENAEFVEQCESCNIQFIGPKAETIKKMGDKAMARETVSKVGVPIIDRVVTVHWPTKLKPLKSHRKLASLLS